MTALEQVAQLKAQAVELLIAERDRIDDELAILQVEKNAPTQKRRGRPAKSEPSVLPDNFQGASSSVPLETVSGSLRQIHPEA
jgi:hypothetical protein